MALVIDNPETELIREKLRAGHAEPPLDPPDIWERIREIQDRVAAMPDIDTRSADEIIGYDEYGVPR